MAQPLGPLQSTLRVRFQTIQAGTNYCMTRQFQRFLTRWEERHKEKEGLADASLLRIMPAMLRVQVVQVTSTPVSSSLAPLAHSEQTPHPSFYTPAQSRKQPWQGHFNISGGSTEDNAITGDNVLALYCWLSTNSHVRDRT